MSRSRFRLWLSSILVVTFDTRGNSAIGQSRYVNSLYYFLDGEDIILNRKIISRQYPRDDIDYDEVVGTGTGGSSNTPEEIKAILSKCDERTRAMILLMVSTGMRIGA